MIQNFDIVKEQIDAKLIPLKTKTDSINSRSSIALDNIKAIKSQADIHVHRIERASEIGKNLTNDINSARDQIENLFEQLRSLRSSLSIDQTRTKLKSEQVITILFVDFFRLFYSNKYNSFR